MLKFVIKVEKAVSQYRVNHLLRRERIIWICQQKGRENLESLRTTLRKLKTVQPWFSSNSIL